MPDTTKWRFEFNLLKLAQTYSASPSFTLTIRGNSGTSGSVNGAFSVKSTDSLMQLAGSAGNYGPYVSPDDVAQSVQNFSVPVTGGASANYTETALPVLIQFVYDVAAQTVTSPQI